MRKHRADKSSAG
jgi:hypothetical protein